MWIAISMLLGCLVALSIGIYWLLVNPIIGPLKAGPKEPLHLSPKNLQSHVIALVETTGHRHFANTKALDEAAQYIAKQWTAFGYAPVEQPYEIQDKTYRNLIASYGPETNERVIVGAHYDVCGEQDGADDNASGVAGLLELSRLFQTHKPKMSFGIDFVAYTLEEPPYFRTENMGSAIHAASIQPSGQSVIVMVSLEMLGYFSDNPNSQQFPVSPLSLFYPTVGNFIAVVGNVTLDSHRLTRHFKSHMQAASKLPVYSINAPAFVPGIDFSDHLNYWQRGYPALMITDTAMMRNINYHQPTDTIDTLNFQKMAEVVKGVYWALRNL